MVTIRKKLTPSSRGSLRQLNPEIDLLYWAAAVINSSLKIDQVLAALINKVRHLLGVVGCSVWMIDPETNEVVYHEAAGEQSDLVRGWRVPVGTGVVGWIAKIGGPVLIGDTRKDTRHFKRVDKKTGLEIRSIMGVPILSADNIIGVIQVVDTAPNRFYLSQLKMMAGLAGSASIAITNANLFSKAQRQIEFRKQTEKKLREREKELVIKTQNLKEMNKAMKVVFKKRKEDKKRLEESVLMNIRRLITPYLDKLGRTELDEYQSTLIEILENNTKDIASSFAHRLSIEHLGLTRREFDIANLICQGKRNTGIAKFLGITRRTVETHRRNLRAKLGINNCKINLRIYLMRLEPEHDVWMSSTIKQ